MSLQDETTLPEWMMSKVVKIASMLLFLLIFLLSIFVFASLAESFRATGGGCYLYSNLTMYGPKSTCDYCIAIAVILFLISLVRASVLLIDILPVKLRDHVPLAIRQGVSITGVHFVLVIIDSVLIIMLLIMSSIISAGISSMCDDLFGSKEKCSSSHAKVRLPDYTTDDGFYSRLAIAEGSGWALFCLWCIITALEIFIFIKWRKEALLTTFGGLGRRSQPSKSVSDAKPV